MSEQEQLFKVLLEEFQGLKTNMATELNGLKSDIATELNGLKSDIATELHEIRSTMASKKDIELIILNWISFQEKWMISISKISMLIIGF